MNVSEWLDRQADATVPCAACDATGRIGASGPRLGVQPARLRVHFTS